MASRKVLCSVIYFLIVCVRARNVPKKQTHRSITKLICIFEWKRWRDYKTGNIFIIAYHFPIEWTKPKLKSLCASWIWTFRTVVPWIANDWFDSLTLHAWLNWLEVFPNGVFIIGDHVVRKRSLNLFCSYELVWITFCTFSPLINQWRWECFVFLVLGYDISSAKIVIFWYLNATFKKLKLVYLLLICLDNCF